MEPELEDGEVKFCPDCNMLLGPFLTYCPNCGTLARVRQTRAELPSLMISRYAVYLAGGFSFMNIFVSFIEALLIWLWFSDESYRARYLGTELPDWMRYVIFILIVGSLLMSFAGSVFGYDAGHKRWNAERLRSVVFSARFLIFLGSLNLLRGFVFASIQMPLSKVWATGASMISPLFWAMGTFMIALSLPGLVIATRWLKREEAEATCILG